MIAFVIYDKKNKKIFAARDRVGIKPFYYGRQNEEFYFGSEIKALISGGFKKEASHEAIYDFLRWGLIDHCEQTFFKNVFSLKPGHFLNIDSKGNIKEGPGFNIFSIKNSFLKTPARGVLQGITRKTVLELATEIGFKVIHGNLTPEEARSSDEVFATSTAGGIIPITKIDDQIINGGIIGPITKTLHDGYWKLHHEPIYSEAINY